MCSGKEKAKDWLAERIGFELTVEFQEEFALHLRANRYFH